jgi:hypothetical protein
MAKEQKSEQANQLNLTVVALVALVAIVGLVALVMNAASIGKLPTGNKIVAADENLAGDARLRDNFPERKVICDTMVEGETKTYTIDATDYETTLVFVSDPASGRVAEAKFAINGALTPSLTVGKSAKVSGATITARNILAQSREGVVAFCLRPN